MANNSQSKINASITKESALNFMEEGQLVEWLSKNGKYIAYALFGLLVLFVILYRYSSSKSTQSEHDYIQAGNEFFSFVRGNDATDKAKSDAAFQSLIALMEKHPELHAAYDGTIAQTLFNRGNASEAMPFAQATLKRTQIDDLPYYTNFGNNTLLIEAGNHKEALEKSQILQQKMNAALNESTIPGQRGFGEELFAMNLFRIGMLQQLLNDAAGELATWQLWKQYAGLDEAKTTTINVNPQAFRFVIQQTAIGSIALPDYITYRENVLKK